MKLTLIFCLLVSIAIIFYVNEINGKVCFNLFPGSSVELVKAKVQQPSRIESATALTVLA